MGKRRVIGAIALGALIFGGAFIAFNWTNIQRLKTVNTLFDEDKIVHNFSNMNEAFLHQQLDGSPAPFIFPEDLQDLPEMVTVAGTERSLEKLLASLDTTGLVILKDGKVIHESYHKGTAQDDLRISWSVAKSFMSGLYGAALKTGAIKSLDDKVEDYAPSLKGSAYEGATIRNVLNMASGITYNEDYMDPKSDINDMGKILGLGGSMDDYAAGLTTKDAPAGERWKYISIDTHIAAMVLRKATGKSLHQLFNETYSANLGFEEAPIYMTDGENVAFALGGLNLTTRDYAKFGQMFLQGGQFNGTQVIPADWVKASTVHSAPTKGERGVGYGYQWWIPMPQTGPNTGDYTAAGIYGQYIYVNPARGIVIAKNAADREFAYPQDGYTHSMNVNMDMFRSLADYYGDAEKDKDPKAVEAISLVKLEPITFVDIDGQNDLFGCGCSFTKDKNWLYSEVDESRYFKSGGTIIRLKDAPNLQITLLPDDVPAVQVGTETAERPGAMVVTKDGQSEQLRGIISCGC